MRGDQAGRAVSAPYRWYDPDRAGTSDADHDPMSSFLRIVLATSALVACDHAGGAVGSDSATNPDACTELSCMVPDCASKGLPMTSISGRVFAPNGTLPLHNVTVYVPLSAPGPVPSGLQCDRCTDELPGGSLTQTATDEAGRFTLMNVPAAVDIPVVIQVGKWRRQLVVPSVAACQDTILPDATTRLPKDRTEGDIPKIAVTTGSADALECLVRKLGISDTEFTTDAADGRVHLYAGNGTSSFASTFPTQGAFPDARTLWNDVDKMRGYDIVVLSCEGAQRPETKSQAAMQALHDYADAGGRVFMSHWHNIWLGGESNHPAHGLPDWQSVVEFDFAAAQNEASQLAIVDERGPRGVDFGTWLQNVGASTTRDQLTINEPRYTATRLKTPVKAQQWLYVDPARSTPPGKRSVQDLLFTTPLDAPQDQRCGKVVFSDMHVSSGSTSSPTVPFPGTGINRNGCATTDLTPQEKALAFMLFDISSCVGPIL